MIMEKLPPIKSVHRIPFDNKIITFVSYFKFSDNLSFLILILFIENLFKRFMKLLSNGFPRNNKIIFSVINSYTTKLC